jgi:hypothetical protein
VSTGVAGLIHKRDTGLFSVAQLNKRTTEPLREVYMIQNQKGKDLLSKKMFAFGVLFGVFVSSGLAPITAVVVTSVVALFLSNIA